MSYPYGFGQEPMPFPTQPGAAGITPGPLPGQMKLPDGRVVEVRDWTWRPTFDTELIAAITPAGAVHTFFRNLAWATGLRKNELYTNMTIPNQLPNGWFGKVFGVHIYVLQNEVAGAGIWTTPEDVKRIVGGSFVQFRTSSDKVEMEGTGQMFPSPWGLTGVAEFAGAGLHEFSAVNNGVASIGALPAMIPVVDLVNEMVFEVRVTFPDGLALDNASHLQVALRTYTAKPVR